MCFSVASDAEFSDYQIVYIFCIATPVSKHYLHHSIACIAALLLLQDCLPCSNENTETFMK